MVNSREDKKKIFRDRINIHKFNFKNKKLKNQIIIKIRPKNGCFCLHLKAGNYTCEPIGVRPIKPLWKIIRMGI